MPDGAIQRTRLRPSAESRRGALEDCMAISTLFLVFREPGPAWMPGVATRQQPLWDEHAAFMDGLFEAGRIVLAGPYADLSRALIIVEARDAQQASDLFRDDPWEEAGILIPSAIVEWTVFLDSRRPGG
jgi:uncharacterized protein YciI